MLNRSRSSTTGSKYCCARIAKERVGKKTGREKKGKGKPVHIFTITADLTEIMTTFEQEKLKEGESVKKDISELKSIIQNI